MEPPPGARAGRALAHLAALSAGSPLDATLRVTLHFHPDRLHQGRPLLQVLADAGLYRSQFETGTSNGGLTARPGGARWLWESRIFGGAYDDAPASERPKYGALNHGRCAWGAAPRFGSAHLRLAAGVLARCSFCYPDSFHAPTHFGVAARMGLVELLEAQPMADPLDRYIEAQVHGELRLDRDVEALVLDPSHAGTETERLARRLPCPLEWHGGFRLAVATLDAHASYRGPAAVALAQALAEDGLLTPRILGEAARSGRHDAQALKHVWHCLARFSDLG